MLNLAPINNAGDNVTKKYVDDMAGGADPDTTAVYPYAPFTTPGSIYVPVGDGTNNMQQTSATITSAGLQGVSAVKISNYFDGASSFGLGEQNLASQLYILSRGQNLVTNGFGTLETKYNFPSFTFDPVQVYAGLGSFSIQGAGTHFNTEVIPVDPSETYELGAYVKETTGIVGSRFYLGLAMIDADNFEITAIQHMRRANTNTTLAANLYHGDTTVQLTSASGWQNAAGASSHQRSIAIYGYQNTKGYTYPNYTYTRNILQNAYADGGISGNTITLSQPFDIWASIASYEPFQSLGYVPAGTAVANALSGGVYKYVAASAAIATNDWVRWAGKISGVDLSGTNDTAMFAPGTANVKLMFLPNYPTGTTGGTQNFSALTLGIKHSQQRASVSTTTTSFTPDTALTDLYVFSNLTSNITFQIPAGQKLMGDRFTVRMKSTVARTITYNAIYRANGVALPTTTVANKWHRLEFECDSIDAKWDLVRATVQA